MGVAMLTLGTLGLVSGCSKEEAAPSPVAARSTQDAKKTPATQQALKEAWDTFVQKVGQGEWKDAFGQYVSKATRVESSGEERASRPKKDATTHEFKRVTHRASNGDITTSYIPADEPCDPYALECGGGGGGGYTPPSYTFVTTEMVEPYDRPASAFGVSPLGTVRALTTFYSTDNPQGFLYDVKIVKGTGAGEPPFNDNPNYRNINVDLNKGAGGLYIYVSFTRTPSAIEYQSNDQFGTGKDEREWDYSTTPITQIHRPVTNVATQANRLEKPDNYHPSNNGIDYSPMWAETAHPPVNSDYMKFPDLNDGAGGRYIYGFQSRSAVAGSPIELGVLASNSSSTQPPSGWTKVGGDLNEGAGGDYIYFCIKRR